MQYKNNGTPLFVSDFTVNSMPQQFKNVSNFMISFGFYNCESLFLSLLKTIIPTVPLMYSFSFLIYSSFIKSDYPENKRELFSFHKLNKLAQ